MSAGSSFKVLVVRVDRLGDSLVTLPLCFGVKKEFPNAEVHFLVRKGLGKLFEGLPEISKIIEWGGDQDHSYLDWVKNWRAEGYRAVIFGQPEPFFLKVAWLARVPLRIGPLNHFWTRMCLNRGLRQHRSRADKHEANYGLELVTILKNEFDAARSASRQNQPPLGTWSAPDKRVQDFQEVSGRSLQVGVGKNPALLPKVVVPEQDQFEIERWLNIKGVKKGFLMLHPGMGGSAKNWPIENYLALTQAALRSEIPVVVTFGPQDDQAFGDFQSIAEQHGLFAKYRASSSDPITKLAALAKYASCVFAPSTGPLHLARAVGTKVVSVFPPVRVQSANRWGPLASLESDVLVLTPNVNCPAIYSCKGESCVEFDCMKKWSSDQVFDQMKRSGLISKL